MPKSKRNKRNEKNNNENIHAVFNIKPIKNSNTAIIKCIGKISNTDNLYDEPLSCSKDNEYVYNITDTIYAKFYRCNIKDSYILTTKMLPVMYASVLYQSQLICGLLFNIFLDFTIKSEIKSEKQLINTILNGQYQLRIKTDDTNSKILPLELFENEESSLEIMKFLLETAEMKAVITKLLEERKKERQDKMGIMNDLEIPKPKYNFTELVKQYENTGKFEI